MLKQNVVMKKDLLFYITSITTLDVSAKRSVVLRRFYIQSLICNDGLPTPYLFERKSVSKGHLKKTPWIKSSTSPIKLHC